MKLRAIKDLSQLDDPRLFQEVAKGLNLIHENANGLWNDALSAHGQSRFRAAALLRTFAAEEAAKYLILIDAIRCPRTDSAQFGTQLGRFNNHLAKGIYAEYADARPATFGEVQHSVDDQRETLYLDGPNEIDWIFPNRILRSREELIYVDYVESDEGYEWTTPCLHDADFMGRSFAFEPSVLSKINVMHAAGFANPEALAIIAEYWRPVKLVDDLHWSEYRRHNIGTLERLDQAGLLRAPPKDGLAVLVDDWTYPMYSIDMTPTQVDRTALKEQQDAWVARENLG